MFTTPALQAQENAGFAAATGQWGHGDGPPGWTLVLAEEDQRGVVEAFPRALTGGRAFRFSRVLPNFGGSRLEQCLPVAGFQELRLRVLALTDTPRNGLALRLRMDFFRDAACDDDATGASQARVETDHVIGPAAFSAGEWGELLSAGRLAGELAADASHVRISVRQRDRSDDGEAADPPLRLWLDRVELVDMGVRISAAERAALLALHEHTGGGQWSRTMAGAGRWQRMRLAWRALQCRLHACRGPDLSYNGLQPPAAELADRPSGAGDGLRLCWNGLTAT